MNIWALDPQGNYVQIVTCSMMRELAQYVLPKYFSDLTENNRLIAEFCACADIWLDEGFYGSFSSLEEAHEWLEDVMGSFDGLEYGKGNYHLLDWDNNRRDAERFFAGAIKMTQTVPEEVRYKALVRITLCCLILGIEAGDLQEPLYRAMLAPWISTGA